MGEPDAVGVEHDGAHALVPGHGTELEDLGVDGGLTAREHDDFGFAFGGHEGVEAGLDLVQRQREPVGLVTGVGEAHRAVEVAGGVDLDDPQAGVLLVVRAQPAVQRAAVAHLGLGLQRQGARLVEPLHVDVHLGVAVEQRFEGAVVPAALRMNTLLSRTLISASMTALHTGQMLLVCSRNTSSRSTRVGGGAARVTRDLRWW